MAEMKHSFTPARGYLYAGLTTFKFWTFLQVFTMTPIKNAKFDHAERRFF